MQLSSNCKPFCSYVRSRLKTRAQFSTITDERGAPLQENKDIADAFNAFFASNFNVRSDFQYSSSMPTSSYLIDSVQFSSEETFKVIQNLPSSHSSNADGLSYLLLKHGNSFIAAKLSALFTLLLSRCLIPDRWRCIMVTPIHKAGPKDKCSNYRPKAITSCVGRVMEMIICKHLTDRLSAISPLLSNKHGFLPGFLLIQRALHSWISLLATSMTVNLSTWLFLIMPRHLTRSPTLFYFKNCAIMVLQEAY